MRPEAVKQIDMVSALELAAHGREVLVLAPGVADDTGEWEEYVTATMESLLAGCLFFRRIPAMEKDLLREPGDGCMGIPAGKQEEDPGTEETPPAEPSVKDQDGSRQDGRKGGPRHKARIDTGKLLALHNAGWNNVKIAEELGVSEATIRKYLKIKKGEKDAGAEQNADQADAGR